MRGVLNVLGTLLPARDRLGRSLLRRSTLPSRPTWWGARRREQRRLLAVATECAGGRGWPVLPGVGAGRDGCLCAVPDCPTPGAHPDDPPLLAATTDLRMVRWWWGRGRYAPVLVATGGAVSAVSLPASAGVRVLEYFDALRIRTGPVIATPSRYVLLVAPYTMQELAELLVAQDWVPTSLRYHGTGGYVVLPPSRTGAGTVRWVREPVSRPVTDGVAGAPWLPAVGDLMGALVAASAAVPDVERLAY